MNFYEQIFSRGRATGEGMTHFERLFAAKFGGSPPPEVREYTGAVPVTITADGTPLIDYLISGNTTQSGTPAPDSPIMPKGTGERTGNLFDKDATDTDNGYVNNMQLNQDGSMSGWGNSEVTEYIELTPNETYRLSNIGSFNSLAYCIYDENKQYITGEKYSEQLVKAINMPPNGKYLRFTHYKIRTDTMLNSGSTALPYEPYGYKIPISSASTTTPVYLGEVQTTRKVKKLVLTGEEANWYYYENATGTVKFFYLVIVRVVGVNLNDLLNTHGFNVTEVAQQSGNTLIRIYAVSEGMETVEEWKSYLQQQYTAGTPVTVWYVLENEETAVVNEPLMKIGDYADTLSKEQALVSIPTNNCSTTVDVDTTVKPSEVYIKYMG